MRHPHSRIPQLHKDTPHGSRHKLVLEPRFNGKKVVLETVGTLDIQEKIESYAPFTDINYMLHRLKVGDFSVLADRQPLYGDFSNMPTNPIDVINLVHSAEASFNELDVDTKKRFNNDWRVWLADIFSNRGDGSNSQNNPSSDPMNNNPPEPGTGSGDPAGPTSNNE